MKFSENVFIRTKTFLRLLKLKIRNTLYKKIIKKKLFYWELLSFISVHKNQFEAPISCFIPKNVKIKLQLDVLINGKSGTTIFFSLFYRNYLYLNLGFCRNLGLLLGLNSSSELSELSRSFRVTSSLSSFFFTRVFGRTTACSVSCAVLD